MFSLDSTQYTKLAEFIYEQDAKVVAIQKQDPQMVGQIVTDRSGRELPYMGAIGGGLTYEFTPTGLGTICKVTYCKGTKFEASVDLTDYYSW